MIPKVIYVICLILWLALATLLHGQIVELEFTAPLSYESSYTDWGVWNLGSEFSLQIKSPVLKKYLKEMEGKKVRVVIKVVEGK